MHESSVGGISRRNVLKLTAGAVLPAAAGRTTGALAMAERQRRKAIVVGAHPDDPETGCGGTMVRLAERGDEVVAAYFTAGEAGIPGTPHEDEKPGIVFAHWPVDTHRDHRISSLLVYDAWLHLGRPFALYYYEVMTGWQTQNFHATCYVDISSSAARKHAACFAHASQRIEEEYPESHGRMEIYRGMEAGVSAAEAFARQDQSREVALP
jgi:LmbE family N-acetylglucosaminyl deacetylase